MKDYQALFQSIPCLGVIPPAQRDGYLKAGRMTLKSYGKNQILHFDGDYCDHMSVILKGQIVVERIDDDGHLMAVADFTTGQSIGANLVFSSNPYYPMTVSTKPPTTVVTLDKQLISDLCASNEDFLNYFLKTISDHTLILGNKIKHHVNSSIRAKIVTYIGHLYMTQQKMDLTLTLSKKALAERMGIQRTSLSRELQKMRKEGLITYDMRTITLLTGDLIKEMPSLNDG